MEISFTETCHICHIPTKGDTNGNTLYRDMPYTNKGDTNGTILYRDMPYTNKKWHKWNYPLQRHAIYAIYQQKVTQMEIPFTETCHIPIKGDTNGRLFTNRCHTPIKVTQMEISFTDIYNTPTKVTQMEGLLQIDAIHQ